MEATYSPQFFNRSLKAVVQAVKISCPTRGLRSLPGERDRDFTYAVTSCDDDLSRFAGMFQCQGRWRYSDACDKRTKSKSFKGVTSVTCLLGKVAWKTSCRFLTQSHPQHGFGSGRCHGCFGYGTPGMQCQNVPTLRWSHQGRPYLTVRIHICWYLYNLYISQAEFMTEETRWVVMSFDEFRYQGWSIPFRWNHPKSKRFLLEWRCRKKDSRHSKCSFPPRCIDDACSFYFLFRWPLRWSHKVRYIELAVCIYYVFVPMWGSFLNMDMEDVLMI